MFCTNCGTQLNNNQKFCTNCGNLNPNYAENNINQVGGQPNQQVASTINNNQPEKNSNNKKIIPFIIGGIIILLIFSNISKGLNNNDEKGDKNSENEKITEVKGNYSREIFSGNTFNYQTLTETAIFTFNKNSTFEVNYIDGNTYKGTYEVYNGLFITVKANEIKKDTTINNHEQLADDINNMANQMMSSNILNTYLLWLETDDNILQPFLITYDTEKKSGVAVNVFARSQGNFTLK